MKRRKHELQYDYCARRMADNEDTKEKMKPRVRWNSAVLVPHPGEAYKDLPESERPLVKVVQQGTYRKKDQRKTELEGAELKTAPEEAK